MNECIVLELLITLCECAGDLVTELVTGNLAC